MRTFPKLPLTGIVAVCAIAALAGSAAWAAAAPALHRLTVWLPGGGSEEITYAGDVAPKVSFTPGMLAPSSFWSSPAFDRMAPAAAPIDPIAAAMDADMAAMMHEADAMMAMPMMVPAFNGMTEAGLPAGSRSYSVVSTMNGNDVCTRSVVVTRSEAGRAPKVVRHSSGNCAAAPDNSVLFHMRPELANPLMTVKSTLPELVPARPHI